MRGDGTTGDPFVALVARLRSAPPPVAVLAGAGTSSSSGVTTGEELLGSAARERGDDATADPVGWYTHTFGAFPNYITMVQEAGGLGSDPLALPTAFFEVGADGPIAPSPAHRAIAAMAARGLVGPILTPNFDRLLEQALLEAEVTVEVAYDLDAMTRASAAPGLGDRSGVLLAKLHGDYRDIRIRDTSCGFATYHPAIEALLERVLSRFDLLVCGWSASWDIALRQALERLARPERRQTYWLLRGTATPAATRVIVARQARVVPVASSNAGLTALARALQLPAGGGP